MIVVCSEGAFKRQQSHLSGEVLNIPTSSSTFDGLFSAGLKFFQAKHAYDYDRLALARYEMLPLCAEEFRLVEMVPNRYVSYFNLFRAQFVLRCVNSVFGSRRRRGFTQPTS